jgi:HSP20 family molecular chaperone IbpA
MTKLTTYTNPIENIERAFDSFFNLTPVFHSLEEVYRTGDTVRFSQSDDGLTVQIDIPGCKNEDLDLSVDSDTRDVYIKVTFNRSFSVGRDYDLKKIKFTYENGVLEVVAPRRKKEEYIKKYSV